MIEILVICAIFAALGGVFIALGFPLKKDKVPPNYWYGYRTKKTLANKDLWYEVNRVAGSDMVYAGAILVGGSIVIAIAGLWISFEAAAVVLVVVTLLDVIWMAAHGLMLMRRR
jgi:uncharacterized membrane protein